jgi:hypothetical protein
MDRRRTIFFFFLFIGASLSMPACVKDDPTITGKRDASPVPTADARPPIALLGPQDDGPDVDDPQCRHCGETLRTDTARGTLCRKNAAPSSVGLLNTLVDCICYDKCVVECGTYCAGSTQSNECSQCVVTQCGTALSACVADVRP